MTASSPPPRRFPVRLLSLVVAGIALIAALFFAFLMVFHPAKLPALFVQRRIEDGLVLSALLLLAALVMAARPEAPTAQAPAPRRGRLDWRVAIPLCALTLLAAFLRFHNLGLQSLWYDELSTTYRMIGPTLADAVQPGGRILDSWPALHIPLYLFVRLAGDTEFALRFPSALASVAAVPVVFVLGRRMFSDLQGLLGASLTVGLQGVIWYAQEARMYGPLMFLAGISGYCWFRLAQAVYQQRPLPRLMTLGYAATLILMIYMHHYGLMLAGIEGLASLVVMASARRISPAFMAAFAATGVSYLPWLPMFYKDLHNTTFFAAFLPSSLLTLLDDFAIFLTGDEISADLLMALCALGLGFAIWRSFRRRDGVSRPLLVSPAIFLGLWATLPILIAYFRSLVATPIVQNRYFLVTLPAWAVLAARALTWLPIRRIGHVVIGAVVPLGLSAFLLLSGFYVQPHATQVRETVYYIVSHDAQYPDSVIAASMLGTASQVHYYFEYFGSKRTIDLKLKPPAIDDSHQRILAAHTQYVWLIGEDYNFDTSLLTLLDGEYTRIDQQRFYNITLWLYKRKASGSTP